MDAKPLFLTLLIAPVALADSCATDPSYGAGCGGGYYTPKSSAATFDPIQADYNYGYGTRTDIYLLPGGGVEVQNHMSSGPQNEVRLYDEKVQRVPITQPSPAGRELQPGLRKLFSD